MKGTTVSQRWRNFRIGRGMYQRMMPMPERPTNENHSSVEAALWYGWMIERAQAIDGIMKEIKTVVPHWSNEYERALTRRVRSLDMEHGLSPFRNRG